MFVVSDPVSSTGIQPTKYVLTMDGGTAFEVDPQTVTGGVRLHYQIPDTLSNGTHNMTVIAKNQWGQSSSVPFSFVKAVPISVSGIALSVD